MTDSSLKYYVYVSVPKIDMLYAQIPRPFLEGLAGELKLNLGILSTSLQQQAPTETQYSRLRAVLRYIEANEKVGTIDTPENYFRGVAAVRWGPYGRGDVLVLFTGSTQRTVFGLGGSLSNVLGAPGTARVGYVSTTPFLVNALCQDLQVEELEDCDISNMKALSAQQDTSDAVYWAIGHAQKWMKGPIQEVEFLAKRLLSKKEIWGDERTFLLGTPIYVALTE